MKIKVLERPVVGCDGKEIEQMIETTLFGFPKGIINQNHLSIHCQCKKCKTHFF